jgi:hypothetical protein
MDEPEALRLMITHWMDQQDAENNRPSRARPTTPGAIRGGSPGRAPGLRPARRCPRASARPSWRRCTASASSMPAPRPCGPHC